MRERESTFEQSLSEHKIFLKNVVPHLKATIWWWIDLDIKEMSVVPNFNLVMTINGDLTINEKCLIIEVNSSRVKDRVRAFQSDLL